MLVNLRFQGKSSYLPHSGLATLETYKVDQIDAELIGALALDLLELLENHLLDLVVRRETLLYQIVYLLQLRFRRVELHL